MCVICLLAVIKKIKMETKSKNISLKAILITMTIGIWAIVLQNAGIIPTNQNVKVVNTVDTYVNGGNIDADVSGSVDVDNSVDVSGYMDVNIEAINGKSNAFYDWNGNKNYVRIPVYNGN
jgi:hypothetical protein